MSDLYTQNFYDKWARITKKSAEAIVPLVLDLVPARSVLDVGCGAGHWLRAFKDRGVADVLGFDGEYVPMDVLGLDEFFACDLRRPLHGDESVFAGTFAGVNGAIWDLAISLEVAEHLPIERAASFVEDLTRFAPLVLFSAAIPGQDGTGHINCQWASWWVELFARRGFKCYDPIRPLIWNNPEIAWWYRQNILLFAPWLDIPEAGPDIDRVHPQHWREKVRVWD
jgi:SAM-dependent methyltransferase